MKITITDKCKEYILNAENGIKFQVKGYAFLVDNERILPKKGSEVKLKDLYRKNPTEEDDLIVLDPLKNPNQDILYRLFDTTYVPATELKTEEKYPFGTYKFRFDQGLNPTKKGGFCCADYNCSKFDAILVIGQKFDEYPTYVKEEERCFLAAYITPDPQKDDEKDLLKIDSLDDKGDNASGPVSRVISWVFSLGEVEDDSTTVQIMYDEDYKNLMENYELKDNQTTMIRVGGEESSKKTALFLVQAPGLGTQYDEVINNLEINQAEEINKQLIKKELQPTYTPIDFSGTYVPTNIILTDETEKVNNLWNVKPAITIFDDHNSPIAKPQMMLSYCDDDGLAINSLAITYSKDKDKQLFSINDVTGNDTIQANLFPEDLHEENKFCVDPEYKPYNNTVVSAWDAEKNNSRFFKLHSNGGYYSGFNVYNTFELSSKGTNLSACSSNTFYVSNYNTLKNSVLSEFIHSNNNNINLLSNASFIDSHNILFDSYPEQAPYENNTPTLTGHTLIGVNGEKVTYCLTGISKYLTDNIVKQGTYNNFTHIGTNYNTQIYNDYPTPTVTSYTINHNYTDLPILNDVKSVKGKVTVCAYSGKNATKSDKDKTDRPIELVLGYEAFNDVTRRETFENKLNVDNFALIGHEGLLASRAFYKDWYYPGREYEGYSNSLKKSNWVLTGTPTGVNPNDFTVVFGNYNSLVNSNKSSPRISYYWLTIQKYYRDYLNDGLVYDSTNTLSSVYNNSNIYEIGSPVVFNDISFYNQQDNCFSKVIDDGSPLNYNLGVCFNQISTDEGDYSLNKLLVVGGGEGYTENTQNTIFSPAENVSKEKHYYEVAKRIDVFSVEKDSFQLVHNNTYDLNPSLSATKVGYIPGMFAVRGWEKPVQKYHYRYTSGYNGAAPSGTNIISATLVTSPNSYNLQNTIYSPTGMLIPLIRSSNDGYKLNIEHINDYIKGSTITGISKRVNFTGLKNKFDEFMQKRYTFVYKTPGVCTVSFIKGAKGSKGTKGTKGYKGSKGLVKGRDYTVDWRYRLYIDDLFNGLNTKGIKLRGNGVKGIKSRVYTIYLVNENKKHTITFKGIRMRKVGAKYQTLMTTRYIHPGMTQRIMFVDNGANGQYGVMNFNYYNENNDSFMTR